MNKFKHWKHGDDTKVINAVNEKYGLNLTPEAFRAYRLGKSKSKFASFFDEAYNKIKDEQVQAN